MPRARATLLRATNRRAAALAAAALVAALATWVLPAAALSAAGNVLLRQAVAADDRVSYAGTVTTVLYGRDAAASTVVRIDHKAPHAWRIWYVAPADAYGRLVVSNETLAYQYEPAKGKVFANRWSQAAPAIASYPNVSRVLHNYSVEVGATTTVADRPAITLALVSKHTGLVAARFWIDAKTKLILRRENYHADGTIASKTSFDNVRYVGDLPADLFQLTVPPEMTLVQGENFEPLSTSISALPASLPFKAIVPKYLPEGFMLERSGVTTHAGVQTLQLIYDDGLRTFSIFENATGRLPSFQGVVPKAIAIGAESGKLAYIGGQTLVSWISARLNMTIVGDLSPKEFARIGASLKP